MSTAKVDEIVESFETLTPPEQMEALAKLLNLSVSEWSTGIGGLPITLRLADETLTPEVAALAEAISLFESALDRAKKPTWGQSLVELVQSLNFGDYSGVEDSVDYIHKQRADQQARRLAGDD